MKRDDELIRSLMIEIEADPDPIFVFGFSLDTPEEDRIKYYHLRLLADAGLVEENERGGAWRMTNDGHDFVGMIKEDTLWGRMKGKATEAVPQYGLRLLFEIGNEMVRQKLRDVGVPLP